MALDYASMSNPYPGSGFDPSGIAPGPITGFQPFDDDLDDLAVGTLPANLQAVLDGRYAPVVNVTAFGAISDRPINASTVSAGTDNTAAFNAAIASLSDSVAAYARETGGTNPSGVWARPTLHIPAGRYTVGDLDPILFPNLRIVGAGMDATVLHHTGTTALFQFGTFTTTPASPYGGEGQGSHITDLSMVQVQQTVESAEGSRTRVGVMDNFSGGVTLERCRLLGWEYGFAGWAGSDFSHISNCHFRACDVGVYLGPRSNQTRVAGCQFYVCEEGLVLGGSQTSVNDCYFIDNTVAHIVREVNTLARRSVALSGQPLAEFPIEIADCWFEDAAGYGNGNRVAPAQILVQGTAGTPRNMWVHDCMVVAGGTHASKRAFLRVSSGTRLRVERVQVAGVLDWIVEAPTGTFPIVVMIDCDTIDGYTAVPPWGREAAVASSGWVGAARYEHQQTLNRMVLAANGTMREAELHDGSTKVREVLQSDGAILYGEYASGSWRDRMKLDIENAAWTFRPDSNPTVVSRDSTTLALKSDRGFHLTEQSDPTAPAADNCVVYSKDNGAGKTQLVVRFPTGAVQVLATEP